MACVVLKKAKGADCLPAVSGYMIMKSITLRETIRGRPRERYGFKWLSTWNRLY